MMLARPPKGKKRRKGRREVSQKQPSKESWISNARPKKRRSFVRGSSVKKMSDWRNLRRSAKGWRSWRNKLCMSGNAPRLS